MAEYSEYSNELLTAKMLDKQLKKFTKINSFEVDGKKVELGTKDRKKIIKAYKKYCKQDFKKISQKELSDIFIYGIMGYAAFDSNNFSINQLVDDIKQQKNLHDQFVDYKKENHENFTLLQEKIGEALDALKTHPKLDTISDSLHKLRSIYLHMSSLTSIETGDRLGHNYTCQMIKENKDLLKVIIPDLSDKNLAFVENRFVHDGLINVVKDEKENNDLYSNASVLLDKISEFEKTKNEQIKK